MNSKRSLFISLIIGTTLALSAQSNLTIQSGGSVTIHGNLTIYSYPPGSPTQGTHVATDNQIIWNWNSVEGATGYKWNMINNYSTAIDMGMSTTRTENGLTCNSSFSRYIWAYNAIGNSAATILTKSTTACPWICGQTLTDTRDGKTYSTVQIGTQCWMSQNLNFGTRVNGTTVQSNNGISEKYCYNNLESNCTVYGGLYLWDELMQYVTTESAKGLCPAGWHLPADGEWCILFKYVDPTVNCNGLGGIGTASAGKMKEVGLTHWASPNTGATNSSGFTGLPGGDRYSDGTFNDLSTNAYFWSSSQNETNTAWYTNLHYQIAEIIRFDEFKTLGHSARCMRD